MGARVYVPSIGRFLQVDPIEGGTDNNYVYPGDPVNDFDLDGTAIPWRKIGKIAVAAAAIGAAVACGASVVCGVAVGVAAGAATYAASNAGTSNFKWSGMAKSAALGGLTAGIATKIDVGGRLASLAWAKGKAGSAYGNLSKHFNNHGKSMGYRNSVTYTAGAIKNIIRAPIVRKMPSGSNAYTGSRFKTTFTYKGRLSSYFKPGIKQWYRW